mmetsp:Transcript_79996/g.124752  ORF Transcript_79996/g.124752 Transcript_79996/m.124752 type:complete len:1771 (+) Transcript_79996:28-5340(+)
MAQLPPMARGSPPAGNVRRAPGIAGDRDNMWEVLHRREGSNSPRQKLGDQNSPLRAAGQEAAGQRAGSVPARNVALPPGELPPRPPGPPGPSPYEAQHREWTPSSRYQRRSVGWEVPKAAFPDPTEVNLSDQRYDMKAGLKNELRHKILNLEAASTDAYSWLERRLESSQADQRADLSRRWGNFEQGDRRFKEWVQREHEDLASQMQQVKAASSESQQQNQRQAVALSAQCQRLELRLQEVETLVTQADAKANGLAHAVQVAGAAHVAGTQSSHATSGAIQGALEALRADLEREAVARAQLGAEATEKIKELHTHIAAVNERQEQEAYGRQQHLVEQSSRNQARVAALEPNFETLRSEIDAMREQIKRGGGDCMRRCEEVESSCIQKVADVREAALRAARETAEEHNNVLAECRASISSLQQILEAKDKIAVQLQSLTQQQLNDDKEGILQRLLQGDDALRSRLSEVEAALAGEQSARLEAQHAAGAHVGRMGIAIEQAQAAWLKESERMNTELRDIRRKADRAVDGEARGWERRLAEAVDSLQRRLDDIESKTHSTKATTGAVEDRLAELARAQENSIGEAEARLRRQVDDLQAIQSGKLSQCDFDLRAALRSGIAEQAERARAELARVEEGAAVERGLLRASLDDISKDAEARFIRLREDFEKRLAVTEETTTRRALQAVETVTQLRKQLSDSQNEARVYADRVAQEAKTAADIALAKFIEDVARETAKADRTVSEIAREIATVEARLQDLILGVDNKAASQLQDGLKLERERTQNEVERLFDEERSHRMQAEAERLASLQKRLGAHEDLTTRRLEDLKVRQDDAFASHRQSIEAIMIQDKKETVNKIEELAREQKNLVQGLENVATIAEDGRVKLEDQMKRELAAFGAKLTVSMTTASTELRHGLKAVDDKLAAAEASNKALQQALEGKIETLGTGLAALALESAAARASIRSDIEAHQKDLEKKIQECETTTEARDVALDTKIIGLEQWSEDIKIQVTQQSADLTSRIAEVGTEATDGLRELRESAEARQAAVKQRVDEIEASMKALDERIAGEISAEQESRLSLVQKLDELDDACKEDSERARAAESQLEKRLDELQKQSTDGDTALGKQMELLRKDFADADAEISAQVEALRSESDGAVGAELRRATAAEAEILEKMEHQKAELLEAQAKHLQSEQEKAKAEQEAAMKMLEQTNKTMIDESKVEVKSEMETTKKNLEALIMDLEARQVKQLNENRAILQMENQAAKTEHEVAIKALEQRHKTMVDESKAEVKSDVEATKKNLEAAIAELEARQVKQLDECKSELQSQNQAAAIKELENREAAAQDKFKELEEKHKAMVDESVARAKADVESTQKNLEAALKELDERSKKHVDELLLLERQELQSRLEENKHKQEEVVKAQAKSLDHLAEEVKKIQGEQSVLKEVEAAAKAEASAASEDALQALRRDLVELQGNQKKSNEEQATKNEAQSKALDHLTEEVKKIQGEQSVLKEAEAAAKAEASAASENALLALRRDLENFQESQERSNEEQATKSEAFNDFISEQLRGVTEQIDTMASQEEVGQMKGEVSSLKKELDELQAKTSQVAAKQEAVAASEMAAKAAASQEEAETLRKLREEYDAFKTSTEADSKNTAETLAQEAQIVQKLRADLDEFQSAQKNKGEENAKTFSGYEEQLGSVVQSVADVMGKLETKAPKEDLNKVKARVEGGFDAIVVQLEAERWLRGQVDSVADGISQSFMHLLDQTSEKLSNRVHKVELALAENSAA